MIDHLRRRRTPRAPTDLSAEVQIPEQATLGARILDVSYDGLGLELDTRLAPQSVVTIRFVADSIRFEVCGLVVWSQGERSGCALRGQVQTDFPVRWSRWVAERVEASRTKSTRKLPRDLFKK
jgi:hypothetical protein